MTEKQAAPKKSMDRITKSLLDKFSINQSLSASSTEVQFEHFANYLVLKQYDEDEISVLDFHTGENDQMSIDGMGIFVNGSFVSSAEEVESFAKENKFIDATFIFIQSKTSPSFDTGDISKFLLGVGDFFSLDPKLPRSEKFRDLEYIREAIYYDASLFKHGNPKLKCYYVTTGIWNNDIHPKNAANAHLKQIQDLQIFREVEFIPLGASELQDLYRSAEAALTVKFKVSKSIIIPTDERVSEAHLALLPSKEYLKLITDEGGNIRRSVFYANVRDFQGHNDVNKEITSTLQSDRKIDFAIRNNGVTVVAKELNRVSDNFTLKDFQIVNGCQTSHVLFANKEVLDEEVNIPIKIVVTEDEDVINSVVRSSNRQTEVTEEDFISLDDFQKKIETYFETFVDEQKIFYERRSKQYAGQTLQKVKVISRGVLVRSFAAMFLDEPHRASRYYGRILSTVGKNIFAKGHKMAPYYTSAYAAYRMEFLFRNGRLPNKYKNFRWYLPMGLRYAKGGTAMPALSHAKIDRYCEKINDALWDDEKAKSEFDKICKFIDKAVAETKRDFSSETARQQEFRDSLVKQLTINS